MFLDSIRERQLEEERKRKEEDGVELAGFRECVRSTCAELTVLTVCLSTELWPPGQGHQRHHQSLLLTPTPRSRRRTLQNPNLQW
jgi:hypothetical protein